MLQPSAYATPKPKQSSARPPLISNNDSSSAGFNYNNNYNTQQSTQPAMEYINTVIPSPPSPPQHSSWGTLLPTKRLAEHLPTKSGPIVLSNQYSVFKLGRSTSSQLRIDDLTVSSRHCSLTLNETTRTVGLVDHKSSNGTYVNGHRIDAEVPFYLAHGDVVSLVSCVDEDNAVVAITNAKRVRTSDAPQQQQRPSYVFVFHQTPVPPGFCSEAVRRAPPIFTRSFGLLSELGRGNFASVYKAVCRRTGEMVAVKVIDKTRFLNMSTTRFNAQVKEAEVLSKINHKYIVQFRDLIRTEDSIYVVTELLRGGELFERLISFGAYPEPRAKLLIRRICEALDYLHERDVVHRDVKPENIVLKSEDDDVDCKLVDFGVATELQGNKGSKTFCGSMSYVAPEVLKRRTSFLKQGTYGKEVDMWSLGVTAHVILSLRPPFDEEDNSQMHDAIGFVLKFETPEWAAISAQAKDFVARCLEVEETQRITARQALQHEWIRDAK